MIAEIFEGLLFLKYNSRLWHAELVSKALYLSRERRKLKQKIDLSVNVVNQLEINKNLWSLNFCRTACIDKFL